MQFITISRGTLWGAELLAKRLSTELGYPLYTRENVIEEAQKYSIDETGFTDISFIDRAPGLWEKQFYKRKHYLLSFQVALLDLLSQGSSIYEGHLGHYLLTGVPFVLKIRVIQSLEKRAKIVQQNHPHFSFEQAIDYIKLIDERRKQWSCFLYGVNLEEPKYYDIVINFDIIDIDTAVKIVKDISGHVDFNSTPEKIQVLKNLHLEAKVKLILFLNPTTRGFDVDVKGDSDSGTITIMGLQNEPDSNKAESFILNALSKEKAVKQISFSY